jgi:hypothetical protein
MRYHALKKNNFQVGDYSITPIRSEDMEDIRKWRNAQMNVLRQKRELTQEDQRKYFTQVVLPLFEHEEPDQLLFSFHKDNERIGYGGLVHLSWIDKRAEMSFLVHPDRVKNQAVYGEDWYNFIQLMKQLCFSEMKFNRLFCETYAFRKFHISVMEKAGMKEEGRLRQHIFEGGAFVDSIMHSILSKEYFEE